MKGEIFLVAIIFCICGAVIYGIFLNEVNGGFRERGVLIDKYQAPSGNYVAEFMDTQKHSVIRFYVKSDIYNGLIVGQMYDYGGENKTLNWYEIPYDDGW